MELILLKDVTTLGSKHDVVTVKNGYGRNYLIPKGIGVIANAINMARLDEIKKEENERMAEIVAEYQATAEKIQAQSIKIKAKAGTSGKIFGSVTNLQIAQALEEQLQVSVDRKKIEIEEDVKELGSYKAVVHLHPQVDAHVAFDVEQD